MQCVVDSLEPTETTGASTPLPEMAISLWYPNSVGVGEGTCAIHEYT